MIYSLKYFQRPYKDTDYLSIMKRTINDIDYIVYRPNHGLCHSLRQGFLVQDIVSLIKSDWLNNEIKLDPLFIKKLAILSSFQRSGRESEISSSQNPELYDEYEDGDVKNMIFSMLNTKYFPSYKELELWSSALKWNSNNKSDKVKNIAKLIKAAHLLDLRRIPHFDEDIIRYEVSELLGITPTCDIMNKLWTQSGIYLNISGDRDLVIGKKHFSDKFFILQQDPTKLYFELRKCMLCLVINIY